MSKSIVVTVPHNLGAQAAKKRIAEGVERLRRDYVEKLAHSEIAWTGDKADLKVVAFSQTVTAQLDVQSDLVRIEVQLPWFLAALSDKLQNVLSNSAKESLQIEHTPPKS
jgi:hypothetical protein